MGRTLERDIFGTPIRRKGAINSKAKGDKNELECAKAITVWAGEKFTRTPSSGGLRWKKSQGVAADLVCEDPNFYFPLSVETKHLKEINDNTIREVWKQGLADAIRAGKLPLLLLRANRQPKFKHEGVDYINYMAVLHESYGGVLLSLRVSPAFTVYSRKFGYTLYVFNFSDIVSQVSYPSFAKTVIKADYVYKFLKDHESTNPNAS